MSCAPLSQPRIGTSAALERSPERIRCVHGRESGQRHSREQQAEVPQCNVPVDTSVTADRGAVDHEIGDDPSEPPGDDIGSEARHEEFGNPTHRYLGQYVIQLKNLSTPNTIGANTNPKRKTTYAW